jgi:hypothetical protein
VAGYTAQDQAAVATSGTAGWISPDTRLQNQARERLTTPAHPRHQEQSS